MSWFAGKLGKMREIERWVSHTSHDIGALLAGARREVWEHLTHVIQASEAEVMAAARAVMDVADRTRTQIERSRSVLVGLEDARRGGISEVVREQSLMLREHVDDMSQRVKAQDEQAHDALAQVAAIGGLARQIAKMASEAQLLALNARIESSRLAGQSQGFNVVATEMMRLSNEVAAANQRVTQVADRLCAILPTLAQGAHDLRGRVDEFAQRAGERLEEVDRKVNALHAEVTEVVRGADAALGAVVRHSQEALSHLQYQDVAAQELRRIDTRLHDLQVAAARSLGDVHAVAAIEPPRQPVHVTAAEGGDAGMVAEPGQVLLFEEVRG
jgi:methyl-accepting chemotaxis protein